jgi:hypothetical protein
MSEIDLSVPLPLPLPPLPPNSDDDDDDDGKPLNKLDIMEIVLESVRNSMFEQLVEFENKNDLFKILRIVIECIELQNLKGKSQQKLAEDILLKLIKGSKMDNTQQLLCVSMIEYGVIGDSIDVIISATKGEINVNKAAETIAKSCLSSAIQSIKKVLTKK